MKISIHNRCSDFNSYRAARVKSLFNADSGCNFDLEADLPIDDAEWKIGLIVGPSGSGKTSLGRKIFRSANAIYQPEWPSNKPIVDAIVPDGEFNAVTAALSAVGLGDVPAWLRPYPVLSNGEKFRANLARLVCEAPAKVVIDEFTSVVDRQIAKFGALAFQKAWRRTSGKCVLLSCHYDIIEWLEPDWVFDTATGKYAGRGLWQRPRFDLELWQTDGNYWPMFEPHHYLKLPRMVAAAYYVGAVDGEPVCHVAFAPHFHMGAFRACRLVVMPEWQGAGVGLRFLNALCQRHLEGHNRYERALPTYFHTSHPGLCAALRRDPKWVQVSASLYGDNKTKSNQSLVKSGQVTAAGFGGHFRAVQGFKFAGGGSGFVIVSLLGDLNQPLVAATRALIECVPRSLWTAPETPGKAMRHVSAGHGFETVCAGRTADENSTQNPDLVVAPLLTRKLTAVELASPRVGVLVFHPSLLPRHRGPDAIKAAFRANERYTGATWFWPTESFDCGDICEQEALEIHAGERPRDFYARAVIPSALKLLGFALTDIHAGHVRRRPQRAEAATYAPRV